MSRDAIQIWFMPWAQFRKPFEFGEIQIWDLFSELESRVLDTEERRWLQQFAASFLNRKGYQNNAFAILQLGDSPFDSIGIEGNSKVRWAGKAIGFSYLACAIESHIKSSTFDIGNSERFQLKCMVIDEDGFIHFSRAAEEGVAKLGGQEILFREPYQNVNKIDRVDSWLLEGLATINDESFESDLWRKLDVCFEWFLTAWTRTEEVSHPAKFVALMTAFESLVRRTNHCTGYSMGKTTSTLCNWDQLLKTEKDRDDNSINKPRKFILDFAGYRNSFVHGDKIPFGLIKHCVGSDEFDPRLTMGLVIYSIVVSLLLKEKVWKDPLIETIARQNVRAVTKILKWDTKTELSPSPHLSYPGS